MNKFVFPDPEFLPADQLLPAGGTTGQMVRRTPTGRVWMTDYYLPEPTDPADWTTALQSAITAASATGRPSTIDVRHVRDTIHVTADLFQGATDVTLLVGRNRWEFDTATCQQTPYHGCSIIMDGATWCPDVEPAGGAPTTARLGFGLISPAVKRTTANLTADSLDMVVASAADIRLGCTLAVMGLSGTSQHHRAVLSANIGAGDTTIPVGSTTGFDAADYSNGVLLLGTEYVSYTGFTATTFTGCTRGAFGTTAASHTSGSDAFMTLYKPARVEAINGTTLTLDIPAGVTLSGVTVLIGAHAFSLLGKGFFDGRRGADAAAMPLLCGVHAAVTGNLHIGGGFTFGRWNHGGVICQATIGTLLEPCVYFDNRRPSGNTGQDVFLFGPNRDGTFQTRAHFDSRVAMFVDDRSSTGGDALIGQNDRIKVTVGPAATSNAPAGPGGVAVSFGASNSYLEAEYISSPAQGLMMGPSSTQWNNGAIACVNNVVRLGRVVAATNALWIGDGTAGVNGLVDGNNVVTAQSIIGAVPNRPVGNLIWVFGEKLPMGDFGGIEVRAGDIASFMDFDFPEVATASPIVRWFRHTSTLGSPQMIWHNGQASLGVDASIDAGGGHTYFCGQGGRLRIGTVANDPDYKLHVDGTIGFMPPASASPANNGDMTFQLTNNTTLVIKVKGSDGVIRSNTLTLA